MNIREKRVYRLLVALAVFSIATGTVFYHFVERLSWLDAYYFSVISLTTVGYGDITPKTDIGKLFTTFYLLIGIGIITTFLSVRMKKRTYVIEEKRAKKLSKKQPKD